MRVAYLLSWALIVLAAAGCWGGGGQDAPPSVPSAAQSPPDPVLIAVSESDHFVTVMHVPSGRTVAELTVGDRPWTLYRPSAGELLVSDVDPSEGRARLLVYGLDRSGPPKWTLPLPERASFAVWSQAMALSADGRYLYYGMQPRGDRGQRVSGYPRHIGIVDLETQAELRPAELPPGCGYYKTLEPAASDSARVFCPPDGVVVVQPDGAVAAVGQVDVPVDFGAVACWSPGSMVSCRLDDGRRIVGERDGGSGFVTTLLLYDDPADGRADRLRLPDGIVHFAPLDADTVGLLEEGSGVIHLYDLASGQVRDMLQGPAGAERLIGS